MQRRSKDGESGIAGIRGIDGDAVRIGSGAREGGIRALERDRGDRRRSGRGESPRNRAPPGDGDGARPRELALDGGAQLQACLLRGARAGVGLALQVALQREVSLETGAALEKVPLDLDARSGGDRAEVIEDELGLDQRALHGSISFLRRETASWRRLFTVPSATPSTCDISS